MTTTVLNQLACSSVGRKSIMAVTGASLFLFVLAHLSGNLLIYCGQDALNTYAANLKSLGALLWVARLSLIGIFGLHLAAAFSLTRQNKAARPIGYVKQNTVQASLPSRTMVMTGVVLFFFILFHIAHYTLHLVSPEFAQLTDSLGRHDVYSMVIYGFQSPIVSVLYVVSMVLLGVHLHHGSQSLAQSIGLNYPKLRKCASCWGPMIAYIIILGNISFPLSVLFGVLQLP